MLSWQCPAAKQCILNGSQIAELFHCFEGEIAWGKLLALYALNIKTKCQVGKCSHWRPWEVTGLVGRDCCWRCRQSIGPGFWVGCWEALEHDGREPGLWGLMDLLHIAAQDECSHGDGPLRQRVLCGIWGSAGAGPGRGGRYSSWVDLVNPKPENPCPSPPSPPRTTRSPVEAMPSAL